MGFTKLFESILESSVWAAPDDFFRAWIALLAKAGPDGVARISATWIAEKCNCPIERARKILSEMQEPDEDSRSENDDGRRIMRVDGGYLLINYQKYREARDETQRREYMRKYITEYRSQGKDKSRPVNSGKLSVNSGKPGLAKAEAEAEADKKEIHCSGKTKNSVYLEIISYLNQKTNRNFKSTPQNIKLINTRIKEGFTKEDFFTVIDNQTEKWLKDEKMREYLRPITLFSNKFESYLNCQPMTWQEKVRNTE